MGIENSVGANLILIRESQDDLYGRWLACLVRISAIAGRNVIGYRGITEKTMVPFGFQQAVDFYEEMSNVGIFHVLTFEITEDVEKLFSDILETAFKPIPS